MPMLIERKTGALAGRHDPSTFIRTASEDVVRVWPIGKSVGQVKNDEAKLLEPATPAEPM